jgi:hypothetical protein
MGQYMVYQMNYYSRDGQLSKVDEVKFLNAWSVSINKETEKTFLIELSSDVNWKSGDFGDSGSCLWGGRTGARKMISINGAAVKVYDTERSKLARAWIAPVDENSVVVWNGYCRSGFLNGDITQSVAELVAHLFEYDNTATISLRNTPPNAGKTNLYFNGGQGILLSSTKISISEYDLRWKEEIVVKCSSCGNIVNDDEPIMSLERIYCESCAKQHLDMCNFNFELYPISRLVKGPDKQLYFDDNIKRVESF